MNQAARISVIIPAYNAERFVAAAIESVLAQDLAAHEIIVVNDGSTDATATIAAKFPLVRLHSTHQQGAGAARNAGVRASSGDFLAFLDADDLWEREKLSLQVRAFQSESELEAVFGHALEFVEGAASREEVGRAMPAPVPGTILITRAAFERIGWFDAAPEAREGADWYLRAVENSLRMQMLSEVVYRRRVHGQNRSIVQPNGSGYLHAIKASLDRRRRSGLLPRNANRPGA